MFELKHVAGGSYYIESPAKIGLVELGNGEVCLIDSGNDKDAGRRIAARRLGGAAAALPGRGHPGRAERLFGL